MPYERVKLAKPHNTKPFILRVEKETDRLLVGVEVDKWGDEVAPRGVDERRHLIQKTEIASRQPMKWNLMYGWLENA